MIGGYPYKDGITETQLDTTLCSGKQMCITSVSQAMQYPCLPDLLMSFSWKQRKPSRLIKLLTQRRSPLEGFEGDSRMLTIF